MADIWNYELHVKKLSLFGMYWMLDIESKYHSIVFKYISYGYVNK